MTKEEKIIVMAYTGCTMTNFSDLHKDVENRLGRPVMSHEFADKSFTEKLREIYREDFIAICNSVDD